MKNILDAIAEKIREADMGDLCLVLIIILLLSCPLVTLIFIGIESIIKLFI